MQINKEYKQRNAFSLNESATFAPMQTDNNVDMRNNATLIQSAQLEREVIIDVYISARMEPESPFHLLLVNDGQDLRTMNFEAILSQFEDQNQLPPLIVVGIHCGDDRMNEYGVAGIPDYKGRGNKADRYEKFVMQEMLPALNEQFELRSAIDIAFAGFSLGALSAFDIAWNNPPTFSAVGVFSGSLWWRSKDQHDKTYVPARDRMIHNKVHNSEKREGMRFFFECGELDEGEDRNRNGVIDSIDDTIDLMRELLRKGYLEGREMFYCQLPDGKHDVPSWAKAWPAFLKWKYL